MVVVVLDVVVRRVVVFGGGRAVDGAKVDVAELEPVSDVSEDFNEIFEKIVHFIYVNYNYKLKWILLGRSKSFFAFL